VQGNHETYILKCAGEAPATPLDAELRRFADWTQAQLQPRIAALTGWPDHLCFDAGDAGAEPAGSWVHVTHGTMAGNRDGIGPGTPDAALRGKLPPDVALFVTAHTHRPLERVLDGTPILNVGSVGSPFDGDVRGSFARLEWRGGRWHREIVRFAYDRARADRDFLTSGFIEEGGPLARILYEEWFQARPLMPQWRRNFEAAVLAGDRAPGPAVAEFLAQVGTHHPSA